MALGSSFALCIPPSTFCRTCDSQSIVHPPHHREKPDKWILRALPVSVHRNVGAGGPPGAPPFRVLCERVGKTKVPEPSHTLQPGWCGLASELLRAAAGRPRFRQFSVASCQLPVARKKQVPRLLASLVARDHKIGRSEALARDDSVKGD